MSETGRITRTPADLKSDPNFADKFPADVDTGILSLRTDYRDKLAKIGVRDVKDLYINEVTVTSLAEHYPGSGIAMAVQNALIEIELPPLRGARPSSVVYAFFNEQKRSRLTSEEVAVLRDCWLGKVPLNEAAEEMSTQESSYEVWDIQDLINKALWKLRNT